MSDTAGAAIKSMATWERKAADLYPTRDIRVTKLLLQSYPPPRRKKVWEPACGAGDISRVIVEHGFETRSTDIRYTGYGESEIDFLATDKEIGVDADYNIITNPPFSLAEEFIRHALAVHDVDYLALLLKSNYWHAGRRSLPLYNDHPPTGMIPVPWRVAFLKDERGNSPLMDVTWFVWERGHPPIFPLLPRPGGHTDHHPLLQVQLAKLYDAVDRNTEARNGE